MDPEVLTIRVPDELREDLVGLLRAEETANFILVGRVTSWRSSEFPWAEVLISLTSAGSLTALAMMLKTWLNRTHGKIEVISKRTGARIHFEGPLDHLPSEKIEALLNLTEIDARSSRSSASTQRARASRKNKESG
jgi:hypothetical protein